nr:hypothetical protein [Paraburkholderia phenoliruptrix]
MLTNDAATRSHVRPQVGIHIIESAEPPGMGIAPIADMDMHAAIVAAALTANSKPHTP